MKRFKKSATFAFHGLVYAFKNEKNFQIECAIAILVLFASLLFGLNELEKGILLIIIVMVLGMELINSAFERVIDMLKPRVHPYARIVKDMMAGAVLLTACLAVVIGALIFLPHLLVF